MVSVRDIESGKRQATRELLERTERLTSID
jgi:hypothetical protein